APIPYLLRIVSSRKKRRRFVVAPINSSW
ncbi:hypothetical protein JMJ77_0006816, partial [Colletotrichum scovillei]